MYTAVTLLEGCQTRFHEWTHQPRGCIQGAECNAVTTLCRYIYTVIKLCLAL